MKLKTIQFFLSFLLSVLTFNMVVDCVSHHHDPRTFCCDVNEFEELNELESRLRSFEPSDFVFLCINFNFIQDMYMYADAAAWQQSGSRAFFPHALHVPIYLDKCTFLV